MAEQAWEEIIKTQDSAKLTPEEKEAKVEEIAKWDQKAKTLWEKHEKEEAEDQKNAEEAARAELNRVLPPGVTSDNAVVNPNDITPPKALEGKKFDFEALKKNLTDFNASLSPGLQKLFAPIIALFGIITARLNNDKAKANLDKVKDSEQLKILDTYWVKTEILQNKDTKITPPEGAKVTWTKSPKPAEWQKDPAKPIPLQLKKEGPIVLSAENSESIEIKDNTNGCTITVKNKDGSTDTYVIVSDKKPDAPKEWTKQA